MGRGDDRALRERVVGAAEGGMSARAAGRRFGVGVATAVRWVRRWREDGTLDDPAPRHRRSVLDAHADWLDAVREAEPELSCRVVAERLAKEHGVRVHEATLWRWLRARGMTFKKSL